MNQFSNHTFQLGNNSETEIQVEYTNKEIDIILLLGEGSTNVEIANHLIISVNEVDELITNLLMKTQTRNTAHLMKYAALNRIIEV